MVLPKLDATESMTCSFHVDDSQKNSIGQDLLLEPKLDLCFLYYKIKGNIGAY